MNNNKTKLQIEFEQKTPTIKGIRGEEYLTVFCTWLHEEVTKLRLTTNKLHCSFCDELTEDNNTHITLCSCCQTENNL